MTREEILALSPGRELDALVAEKVMGWEKDFQCWKDESGRIRTIEATSFGSFEPSTDISAAWEVVEKMGKKEFTFHAESTGDLKEVRFMNSDKGIFGEGYSYSMPLSICKAALLAVMDKDETDTI